MRPVLWVLVAALFPHLLGFLLYFVMRHPIAVDLHALRKDVPLISDSAPGAVLRDSQRTQPKDLSPPIRRKKQANRLKADLEGHPGG